MVFSPLHWIPSALAALLTFSLAFNAYGKPHKALGAATLLLALTGFSRLHLCVEASAFFP